MSVKEKIMAILGVTEEQYEKELAKNEYERAKMGCISEYIDQRGKSMATGGNYITAAQANAMNQTAQLQSQYHQQLQLANAAGNGLLGQYATTPTPDFYKTFGIMHGADVMPTFEELNDPDSAFSLPLEALATMWNARFGYNWVKDEDTTAALDENERMWLMAVKRLSDAGWLVYQQFRQLDSDPIKVAWKLVEKHHGNR